MKMKNRNIMIRSAACCAAALLALSGCGKEIGEADLSELPANAAVSAETSAGSSSESVSAVTLDESSSETDSLPDMISGITEISDSSSSAEKSAAKSSGKIKSKNKKAKSENSDEKAVTDTDSSAADKTGSDGKKNKSDKDGKNGKNGKKDKTEPAEDKSGDIILNYNDKLEAYSKVKLKDFIERTNAELIEPDALVDTKSLGKHEQTIKLKFDGQGYSATVRYTVEDTRAPIVLVTGENSYLPVGSYFDLGSLVSYADNFDRSPKLSYNGEVDTSSAGTYPITATITDSSGNSYSWDLTIYVGIQPPVNDTMTGDGMSFDEFKSAYAGDNRSFGIDVSQWQGVIDWQGVKDAGCDFAIMRIGWGDNEDYTMDEQYLANIDGATAAGIKVGIYFYSEDNDPEDVRDHARWIAGVLAGRKLDFPIAFDWEDFEHFQSYGMSIDDLNELFEVFADELSLYGYETMLYSSKNFLENFWTNDYHRMVWLAHYVDQTDYAGEYKIWQRCFGSIGGIGGDTDFNVMYE